MGVVVFDLDGTLVDTGGDIVFSANHVRSLLGQPPLTTAEVLAAVGFGPRTLISRTTGVPADDADAIGKLLAEYQRHYAEHQAERSFLYPGIDDLLVALAQRHALFVLSNKPHPAVLEEVRRQGIDRHLREAWGSGFLTALKPDPAGIDLARERAGASRDEVVMVGDLAVDILTGINAGVRTCHVRWGFGRLGPGDPSPTVAVRDAQELESAIAALLGGGRTR